jgi:hypothetical protein
MIPNHSVITYIGTWQTDRWTSPNDTLTNVTAALQADGLSMRDAQVNVPLAVYLPLTAIKFNVHLTLQVENGLGFATPDDIIAIVRHEVYQVTGAFPSADSVPTVVAPGQAPQATGQPTPTATPDALTSLSEWLKNLTTKGMWMIGVVLVLAIVGSVLVMSGENKVSAGLGRAIGGGHK